MRRSSETEMTITEELQRRSSMGQTGTRRYRKAEWTAKAQNEGIHIGHKRWLETLLQHWRRKANQWDLLDDELQIFPTGFPDKAREAKYQKNFFLTFPQNHKNTLLLIYVCAFMANASAAVGMLWQDQIEWAPFLGLAFLTSLTAFVTYHLAQTHLSAFFKWFFGWLIWFVFWAVPLAHVAKASSASCSHINIILDMTIVSFAFPFTHPDWVYSTSWTISAMTWVPALSQCFHHGPDGTQDMLAFAILNSLVGPIWGAWLAVTRRRDYMKSHRNWKAWIHPCPTDSSDRPQDKYKHRTRRRSRSPLAQLGARPRSQSLFKLYEWESEIGFLEQREQRTRTRAASCDGRIGEEGDGA